MVRAMPFSALLLWLLACGTAAVADCPGDRVKFQNVLGSVDNPYAKFEWASYLAVGSGNDMVWNYVWNKGQEGLSVIWQKAGVSVSSWMPIAPGEPACFNHPLFSAPGDVVPAPLLYGISRQLQMAAVFDPVPEGAAATRGSEFAVTVLDGGVKRKVDVRIASYPNAGGVELYVSSSRDIIVGVSTLGDALTQEDFAQVVAQVKNYKSEVTSSTLADFSPKYVDPLSELIPGADPQFYKGRFLFFNGEKSVANVKAKEYYQRLAEVIAFKLDGTPIFATKVNILVPAQ
jgi:hypothetical protein